jgi:hypothetical protein
MGWVVSVTSRPRFTPAERTPFAHYTVGWVDPRVGLDSEVRGKILCLCRGSNLDRPFVQYVDRHYTDLATPAPMWAVCRLGGVVVSELATGPKGSGVEPGQGDGFLRAIKIRSTPYPRMGSKAGRSHVVKLYGMYKISWSPTGMNRLNSHFLRPFPTAPEESLMTARALWYSHVSPSRSRLLSGSQSLSPRDSTTCPRPQCWEGSLTTIAPTNLQSTIWTVYLHVLFSNMGRFHMFDRRISLGI